MKWLAPVVGRVIAAVHAAVDVPLIPTWYHDQMAVSLVASGFWGLGPDGSYYTIGPNGLSAPTAYAADRYVEFDFDDIYPPATPLASANFKLALRAPNNIFGSDDPTRKTYLFFEVRRRTTDALLATHGSIGAPLTFGNGATTAYGADATIALPEVASSDDMNDLYIRIWAWVDADPFGIFNLWRPDHVAVDTVITGYPGTAHHFAFIANLYQSGVPSRIAWWAAQPADGVNIVTQQVGARNTDGHVMQFGFHDHGLEPASLTGAKATITIQGSSGDSGGATNHWQGYLQVYRYSTGALIGAVGSFAAPSLAFDSASMQTIVTDISTVLTNPADLHDCRLDYVLWPTDFDNVRTTIEQVTLEASYPAP